MKVYSKVFFLVFLIGPLLSYAENKIERFDHSNVLCTPVKKNTHRATFPAVGVEATSLAKYKTTLQRILDKENETIKGGYHFDIQTTPYSFIHADDQGDKSVYIAFYGESDSFGGDAVGYFAFMFLELGPKPSVLASEDRLFDFLEGVRSGRLGLDNLSFATFPPHAGQEVKLSPNGLGFSTPAENCEFIRP